MPHSSLSAFRSLYVLCFAPAEVNERADRGQEQSGQHEDHRLTCKLPHEDIILLQKGDEWWSVAFATTQKSSNTPTLALFLCSHLQ